MIARLIDWSLRNRLLVLLACAVLYFTYLIASHRGMPNVLVIMTALIALYGFVTRRTVIGRLARTV